MSKKYIESSHGIIVKLFFPFPILQGDLETQRIFWKKQNRELKEKFILYSIRIAVNVLVVAILGASLYLIFFTNDKMLEVSKLVDVTKRLVSKHIELLLWCEMILG